MKFRKKPVVIEAEQFFPETRPLPFAENGACALDFGGWYVVTIHGQRTPIVAGDWIIPEPDGIHFYPCKPDIFASTYEAVEPGDTASERFQETLQVELASELRDFPKHILESVVKRGHDERSVVGDFALDIADELVEILHYLKLPVERASPSISPQKD